LISNIFKFYLDGTTISFNWTSLKEIPMELKEFILNKLQNGPPQKNKKNEINDFTSSNNLGLNALFNSLETFMKQEKNVKLFSIDDMFAPHNMQNITQNSAFSNFNVSQRFESEVSYLLEMQPDATYQVKYKKAEREKSFSHIFEDIVFSEFYELQYFQQDSIEVNYKKFEEFESVVNITSFYDSLIRILISYDKLTYSKIKKSASEKEEYLNLAWNYSVDDARSNVVFCKDLFPLYLIMKIRSTMNDFQNGIQMKINIAGNFTPFRINILSFCDVLLSHVLKCLKNTKEETKEKYLGTSQNNLFTIINNLLENSILKSLLFQIIRKIMIEQTNVLKIIRGIYVQFREKNITILHEKENIDDIHLKGLDKLFRFSRTNYFIYKYMLVIEFQVVKMHESLEEIEIKNYKFDEETRILNDYLFMVTNKFEFYECIFNNEQIISSLLGKFELENKMLDISKNLSILASKIMTISINFDNLLNILKKEFYTIKSINTDRYEKILKYEQVK